PCTSHFIVRRPPPSTLSPYTTLFRSRLRLDLDGLAGRHAEGGAVHQLAVDQDVAVHDGLAGLEDGAGEAGAQDERVQAHLQQLEDRKSTRLNSSHVKNSYAVFCLKKT